MRDAFDADSEVRFLVRRWGNGESALPIVRRLIDLGFPDEAAATARLALVFPECLDREQLEAALFEIASPPDGWLEALTGFARNPSEERWKELMTFVPEEVFYQRLRNTMAILMRLGCDGDILFRCASRFGMTSDLFDLARTGTVDPLTIEERGAESAARAAWLGLAAMAAFARGDRFATLRYLRAACSDDDDAYLAWAAISEIRRDADEALNHELDKLGVPRV